MIWTAEMCACQRIDIFQEIPTENMPDLHSMLMDGVVVQGDFELPAGLETENVSDIGNRISNNFDALEAQKAIVGFKLPET